MTARVPTPLDKVRLIKGIINQDRRERHLAGFKLGSWNLAKRIATELNLPLHTVLDIKERKRHKHVLQSNQAPMQETSTVPAERLEKIRQRRIREGLVTEDWKPLRPDQCQYGPTYRTRLRKAKSNPGVP